MKQSSSQLETQTYGCKLPYNRLAIPSNCMYPLQSHCLRTRHTHPPSCCQHIRQCSLSHRQHSCTSLRQSLARHILRTRRTLPSLHTHQHSHSRCPRSRICQQRSPSHRTLSTRRRHQSRHTRLHNPQCAPHNRTPVQRSQLRRSRRTHPSPAHCLERRHSRDSWCHRRRRRRRHLPRHRCRLHRRIPWALAQAQALARAAQDQAQAQAADGLTTGREDRCQTETERNAASPAPGAP